MAPPTIHVAGHDIGVSKLDKVLFPDDGFTKGEMLLHYVEVADVMVPQLAGRPLTMRRFPEGIGADGFFQKDASSHFPDWITTVEVPHRRSEGTVRYVVCEDAATLVYLATQGTIEFHIWTARADRLDHPDRLVMDLDPPPGIAVATLRSVARRARDLYTEVGLTPFVQTTGGRGYHVVAPLDRDAHPAVFGRADVEDAFALPAGIPAANVRAGALWPLDRRKSLWTGDLERISMLH